jgi:hypothetical protein
MTYEAIRLTGFGPVDTEIFDWVDAKACRGPINIDLEKATTVGRAYSENPDTPYLVCNGYSSLGIKKLKSGRWVVWNVTQGRLNLLKNSEYDALRTQELKEKHDAQEQ